LDNWDLRAIEIQRRLLKEGFEIQSKKDFEIHAKKDTT
jgi:hypothetical protein